MRLRGPTWASGRIRKNECRPHAGTEEKGNPSITKQSKAKQSKTAQRLVCGRLTSSFLAEAFRPTPVSRKRSTAVSPAGLRSHPCTWYVAAWKACVGNHLQPHGYERFLGALQCPPLRRFKIPFPNTIASRRRPATSVHGMWPHGERASEMTCGRMVVESLWLQWPVAAGCGKPVAA